MILSFVVVSTISLIISSLVLITGRLQSTVFGQLGFLLLLWAVSVLPFLVKQRAKVLFSLAALFVVDALTLWMLLSPLTVWITENRDIHDARALLRLISSEQDQFWLEHKRYSSSIDDLIHVSDSPEIQRSVVIKNVTATQWDAEAKIGSALCTWGKRRNTSLFDEVSLEPTCLASGNPQSSIFSSRPSYLSDRINEQPEISSYDGAAVFPQHRFDGSRQAIVPGEIGGSSWSVRLDPEIRASPSIGYNSVYIGAHGSGELTALSLETGQVRWGIRVPNWIHHEPVIADGRLFVGFGDNHPNAETPTLTRLTSWNWAILGSSPSGIQALDAFSGKSLWRHYTSSSMMASPLIYKHLVIARESAGVVHAWDLRSGRLVWSKVLPLPAVGPMTNPLLVEDVVIVASDPGSWCAISAHNGSLVRCQRVADVFYGPGHSSPAARDSILVYQGVSSSLETDLARVQIFDSFFFRRLSEVFVEAVNWKSGAVLWRRAISGLEVSRPSGHIAGTPVIAGQLIVVVMPVIGEIVSLNLSSGTIRWRKAVHPARGSPVVYGNKILVMTTKPSLVVLDVFSGKRLCENLLPHPTDRAGITVIGGTGVAAFLNGEILAAPVEDWVACNLPRRSISG